VARTDEHEVYNSLFVDRVSKVLVVSTGEASVDTMVLVHHTRNTIESEAVELEFIHPEAEVAEQESENLMVGIVEEATIPQVMAALATLMEVEVISAVEFIQTIQDVLAGMGMDDIKKDGDTHSVGGIDQLLEVFG
jgi:hypothetical protein